MKHTTNTQPLCTVSLSNLKDNMKVANVLMEPQTFLAKLSNNKRDIKIEVTYFPEKNVKEDIYPYWKIYLQEEESYKTVLIDRKELHKVRDIFNGFTATAHTDISFIETSPLIHE